MIQEHELLKSAAAEIRSLRNQNTLMSARLDMFDSIMAILHTEIAHKSQGVSPDIAWQIDKFINQHEQEALHNLNQ